MGRPRREVLTRASDAAGVRGRRPLEISADALALLCRYHWPGNVRELQRVMSVAAVLAQARIMMDDLPDRVRAGETRLEVVVAEDDGPVQPPGPMLPDGWIGRLNLREIKEWAGREAQKRVIMELQTRGNVSRQELARMLGVDPKTLRSRLKEMSEAKIARA